MLLCLLPSCVNPLFDDSVFQLLSDNVAVTVLLKAVAVSGHLPLPPVSLIPQFQQTQGQGDEA